MRSKGSGESAHLHRLTLAIVTVPNSHVLPQRVICVLFTQALETGKSKCGQASMSQIVTGQWDKISCAVGCFIFLDFFSDHLYN